MEIGTKIDVLEDEISSTDYSNLNIGKEEASISKDVGGVGIEQRSPKFSFHQSNMLYILFLLGFASCIILDVLVQFHRKKWSILYISPITRWAVALLLVNVGLWVDFMIGTKKKQILESNNQESNWLHDLTKFSSNSLVCIVLLPFFLCRKMFSR